MIKNNESVSQSEYISRAVITLHKKIKEVLKGKSMIDGYTVTIRDAIEAADFINRFKDSIGLDQAIILGIGRQYHSRLKNKDKPAIIEALKELKIAEFPVDKEAIDIEEVLYLGGKSSNLNLSNILGGSEKEQLGNLFHILTLHAPEQMQEELDMLRQMLASNEKTMLVPAINTLTFLPDEVKKLIVEFGLDIYSQESEIFLQLIIIASGIKDENWKQRIIENNILPGLWSDIYDDTRDALINTIEVLSESIKDKVWKRGIIEDMLVQKLLSFNTDIRSAAAGAIGAVSVGLGNEKWKKEIVEDNIMPLTSDNADSVASWSVRSVGTLSLGVQDGDWKRKIVDHLLPRLFDNKLKVRITTVETIGRILSEIDSESFKRGIVKDYLLEKLLDERSVQVKAMESFGNIFSTIASEEWKKEIIENNLLPMLQSNRENKGTLISGIKELLLHIKNEEWKIGIIENSFLPKLKSVDWYIQSETLKMLGSLNSCVENKEWKQNIVNEHLVPGLSSKDKDIQSAASQAIGILCEGNGAEQWRKEILEKHLLPKILNEEDGALRASLFNSIGAIIAEINNGELRQKVITNYMLNGSADHKGIQPDAAEAICKMIEIPLNRRVAEVEPVFLKNLEAYLTEDASAAFPEGSFDDTIIKKNDCVTIGRFIITKSDAASPHIPDEEESVLINTKTTVEDLEFLAASVLMDSPVLEIGPTATRKSALIQYLAYLANAPYRRFNLNGQTDKYEFIGGYKPDTGLILDGESRLEWQDGILIEALKNGYYLNIDEINLSETEVLERLNSLLDDERSIVVYEHENEKYIKEDAYDVLINKYIRTNETKSCQEAVEYLTSRGIYKIHENFRLFATMNPKEYKGRNKLSDPFLNRWMILRIEELPDAELAEIMNAKYHLHSELIMPVILFHQSIREQAENGVLGKQQREEYHFTIRDLIRVFERVKEKIKSYQKGDCDVKPGTVMIKLFMAEAVMEVYGMVFRDADDRNKYGDFHKKAFGDIVVSEEEFDSKQKRQEYIKTRDTGKVVIGQTNQVELGVFVGNPSMYIPNGKSILMHVKTTLLYIKTIAHSIKLNEPIHLVGPTASAKTSIIRYIAYLTNSGFQRVSLAGQTDTADIIGQYQPTEIKGCYAWKDGTLLQAMKNGDYLLLDELNLAEPQILERLNSLLDTGRIVISEHNNETYIRSNLYDKMVSKRVIDPDDKAFVRIHENFRIVAASNPVDIRHQGRTRLSLAFRNRFREVWMDEIDDSDELIEIVSNILVKNIWQR